MPNEWRNVGQIGTQVGQIGGTVGNQVGQLGTTVGRNVFGGVQGGVAGLQAGFAGMQNEMAAAQERSAVEHAEQLEMLIEESAARMNPCRFLGAGVRKRCSGFLKLTLPKYVEIHNPKISIFTLMAFGLFIAICGFSFFQMQSEQVVEVLPETTISMLAPSVYDTSNFAATCPDVNATLASLLESTEYANVSCAGRCGSGTSSGSCVYPHEYLTVEKNGEDSAFIPTYYEETYSMPQSSSGCSTGFESVNGSCVKTGKYLIAGADNVRVAFTFGFEVSFDMLFVGVQRKKCHQGAFHSQGWPEGLRTVLIAPTSAEDSGGSDFLREFEDGTDTVVNMSLAELLEAAWYSGLEEDGVDLGNAEPLSLQSTFLRSELDMEESLPLWVTGASITVDLHITDMGKCTILSTLRQTQAEMREVQVPSARPVACISVHAERMPVYEQTSVPVGISGGSRHKKTHGVRIKFRKLGAIRFFDHNIIAKNVTMFYVLMTLPLIIIRIFVVHCLGGLSDIYKRVMNQELNLAEACKGLAARLVSHSTPFMDLIDGEPAPQVPEKKEPREGEQDESEEGSEDVPEPGISKDRILARIREFLQNSDAITHEELLRFVDEIFDGLKSLTEDAQDTKLVNLSEFSTACCSNEPLSFDSLVQLFDKDRKTGWIEWLFLDDDIRQVHKAASGVRLQRSQSFANAETQQKKKGSEMHSRVEESVRNMQILIDTVTETEMKAREAAQELDAEQELSNLFGEDSPEANRSFPAPPKTSTFDARMQVQDEAQ